MTAVQYPYLDYLPEVFSDIREFAAIGAVVDEFIAEAYETLAEAKRGLFAASASGEWLAHHESLCGVIPRGGESEDERRVRLGVVYSLWAPYTASALRSRLSALCGEGNYEVYVDAASCTLSVAVACDDVLYDDICAMVDRIAPCNLTVRMVRR